MSVSLGLASAVTPSFPSSGDSGLDPYQIISFTLGSGMYEIMFASFKTEFSISPSSVGLLQLSPAGLESQIL